MPKPSRPPEPKPDAPAPDATRKLTAEIVRHCASVAADLRETPYTRFCKDLGNATPVEVEDWPTLTQGQRGLVAAMLERPDPQDVERLPSPRFKHEANEYLVRHAVETGALAPDFDARHLADFAAGHHFPLSAEGRRVLMNTIGPAAGGPPAAAGAPRKQAKPGRPRVSKEEEDLAKRVHTVRKEGTAYAVIADVLSGALTKLLRKKRNAGPRETYDADTLVKEVKRLRALWKSRLYRRK